MRPAFIAYKGCQDILDGFWAIWRRLGIPDNVQVDNAMSIFGSLAHPRGMGPLIRLCLNNGVEPWFIPMAEPRRNGIVEQFNDLYQQKFLAKVTMATEEDLKTGSLAFEHRHNSSYRYSKLAGKTPLTALATSKKETAVFPAEKEALRHRLKKPETGRYHLVRLIRTDLKLNIFGETFPVPPELKHEYAVATIDVKELKLKVFLGRIQAEKFDYKLR